MMTDFLFLCDCFLKQNIKQWVMWEFQIKDIQTAIKCWTCMTPNNFSSVEVASLEVYRLFSTLELL